MISVLILTKNEEFNLPHLMESLVWCDDIVVLDSNSTDSTVAIAQSYGARVVARNFDNWSAHLNWAGTQIKYKYKWLYYSDADEVVPEDLKKELLHIAADEDEQRVAFRLRYKNYFLGKWIRRCGIYPVWVMRFYQPAKLKWERLVNPTAVVDGTEGNLRSHFLHYSFRKGLFSWFEKHNKYSSDEAVESLKSISSAKSIPFRSLLPWAPPAQRRVAMKELSFRMPFRPLLRFIYMYFIKLGFLDGLAGFHYCVLLSIYEYMIVLKIREKKDSIK